MLDSSEKQEGLWSIQTLRPLLLNPMGGWLCCSSFSAAPKPQPQAPPLLPPQDLRLRKNREGLLLLYPPGHCIWPGSYPSSWSTISIKASPQWGSECWDRAANRVYLGPKCPFQCQVYLIRRTLCQLLEMIQREWKIFFHWFLQPTTGPGQI